MDEDYKEAWKSYLALCRLSASKFYPEMLRECGLKVPFEDGYFEEIVDKLEKNDRKNKIPVVFLGNYFNMIKRKNT